MGGCLTLVCSSIPVGLTDLSNPRTDRFPGFASKVSGKDHHEWPNQLVHWWVLVHQRSSPWVPGWVQDSKVLNWGRRSLHLGTRKALSLIGSCRCSFACLPILATGTCEPPTGMLQYNSHYPCHKQRWNLQWIQSMLSGAFDLGTKRVMGEPPCKLVNNRGAKQTMLSLRSIQMDVGDCITLRHPNTPHSKEITSRFQHHLWSRRLCLARLPSIFYDHVKLYKFI